MPNRVDITRLTGGKKPIYHVYIESDGYSGDLSSYEIILPENEQMEDATQFTIENITWSCSEFSARIHFELLSDDTLIWVLPKGSDFVNFKEYGGLKDRGNSLDASGKILLTTVGLTEIGRAGSFIIKVKIG